MIDDQSPEFCPSCGEWVKTLDLDFGWCSKCIAENVSGYNLCATCGTHFETNVEDQRNCILCVEDSFLEKHADRIEYFMSIGFTLYKAMESVRRENRPICVVCENHIRHARSGASFCRQNIRCLEGQQLYEKFRRQQRRRGESPNKQLAIAKTLEALNGSNQRTH